MSSTDDVINQFQNVYFEPGARVRCQRLSLSLCYSYTCICTYISQMDIIMLMYESTLMPDNLGITKEKTVLSILFRGLILKKKRNEQTLMFQHLQTQKIKMLVL